MRSTLGTADAVVFYINGSDGGVWSKSQFDKTIEVNCEIDPATVAVDLAVDVLERSSTFLWPTT